MLILRNPALIAFEAIVEAGTVHGAAKNLKLTQTAITLRLKNLEAETGLTLFLRSRRGMTLTEEGKALLQLCKSQKELEGQFLGQVSGSNRRQVSLTIIGPTSAISSRITEDCLELYSTFPFLNLHLRVDDHSDLIETIRRGEADLAIVQPDLVPNEMDSKVLKPDRYLLVGCAKWKGRRLDDILENERIIDFHEDDRTTEKYFEKFKLKANGKIMRLFVNNNEALIRLFKAGVGFGTLTESVAHPLIKSGALITLNGGKTVEDPLALAWYPRSTKQKYFEALIRSIH